VWQGFASGRSVLAATITLAPTAASVLPLRVLVERRAGARVVRLEDVARGRFTVTTGSVAPAAATALLERLRREGTTTVVPSQLALPGRATGQAVIGVTAPLRLRHDRGPGAGAVALSVVLARAADRADVHRSREGLARARPAGRAARALEILPGRRDRCPRWRASSGHSEPLLSHGSTTTSRLAGPVRPSTAVYAYRTVERLPVLAAAGRSSGGDDTLTIVLVAVLGAAALVGGAILWAHL
jgi:hypothetical protein